MAALACFICTHKYGMETSEDFQNEEKCEEGKKLARQDLFFLFWKILSAFFFCKLLLYFSSFKSKDSINFISS